MKLEFVNHLLEVGMTISYKGKQKTIDKLVVDTGAAHTLISSDIVDEIGIYFENGDSLVSSYGIGGQAISDTIYKCACGSTIVVEGRPPGSPIGKYLTDPTPVVEVSGYISYITPKNMLKVHQTTPYLVIDFINLVIK